MANAWLLYRRNHHNDAEKSLPLVRFRGDIADWLLRDAIVLAMRKGIPPSESHVTSGTQKKMKRESAPSSIVAMIAWPSGPKWSTKDKICAKYAYTCQLQRAPLPR